MPITVSDILARTGTTGGVGAAGTAAGAAAALPGGVGAVGGAAALTVGTRTLLGDGGADSVAFGRDATGGTGGIGGAGGAGASFTTDPSLAPGATGGVGGLGGAADARLWGLTVQFADAFPAADGLTISLGATGGTGGTGGVGGAGGQENPTISDFAGNIFNPQGGGGGEGGVGGDGALGRAVLNDATVQGARVNALLDVTATGGEGGTGGSGGAGGKGGTIQTRADQGTGGEGGAGGDGGTALARVFDLDIAATTRLELTLLLSATGGAGGDGGAGGAAGFAADVVNIFDSLTERVFEETDVYLSPGAGGAGGDGGDASARLLDSRIIGGDGTEPVSQDLVLIRLIAEAGAGGVGGAGGPGVAASTANVIDEIDGVLVFATITTAGTAPGTAGATGTSGDASVIMRNTTVALGDGDDTLSLAFLATGGATNTVTVAANSFDGGGGEFDKIILGDGVAGGPGYVADLMAGTLRVGGATAPRNTLQGFERFVGSSSDDIFRDGAGNQTFDLRAGGNDRLEFTARNAGGDIVQGLSAGDTILLRGFGTAIDSFEEVLARVIQAPGYATLSLPGGSLIAFVDLAAPLTADMFLFG
jgi:hypothetical protein